MKLISAWLALLWVGSLNLYGQGDQLTFTRYDGSEGLASNAVNDIDRDARGFLWVATSRGLHRFDGYRFRGYQYEPGVAGSLPDNYISTVFADSKDRIWAGTNEGGVARLDRKGGTFTSYFNPEKAATRLSHNQVTDIGQRRDGTIIVSTAKGYNLYDEQERRFHFAEAAPGLGWLYTGPGADAGARERQVRRAWRETAPATADTAGLCRTASLGPVTFTGMRPTPRAELRKALGRGLPR